MKCGLCLQEKKLVNKSHIVPDFMYERLFDDKHRIDLVRLKEKKPIPQKPLPQTSLNEPNLLCSDCDGIKLSQLENYFRQNLFDPVREYSKTFPPPKDLEIVEFSADYNKIKLFFLSILWRHSILKKPENKPISLGKHQEIIRKMIYENDPKEIHDYPFSFYCFLNKENYNKDDFVTKVSGTPVVNKRNQGHEYIIFYPGYWIVIRISSLRDDMFLTHMGEDKVLVGYSPGHKEKELVKEWFSKMVF